jgi:hypothetical protein
MKSLRWCGIRDVCLEDTPAPHLLIIMMLLSKT